MDVSPDLLEFYLENLTFSWAFLNNPVCMSLQLRKHGPETLLRSSVCSSLSTFCLVQGS